MKFHITIAKGANFYFFVQNMAQWHFSTIPAFTTYWEQHLGSLSRLERQPLSKFARIHQRYSFGSLTPLYVAFLGERIQWQIVKQTVSEEEYEIVRKIFANLKPKFLSLYNTELPALRVWQKKLSQTLPHHPQNNEIITLLSKLYVPDAGPTPNRDMYIFPVISAPSRRRYATAYPEKSTVLLPLSAVSLQEMADTLGIIWHEVIHLYFDQPFFIPRLQKIFSNDLGHVSQIMELTASALFPGLLAHRFFNIPIPTSLHANIASPALSQETLKLITPYVKNRRPFDEEYIRQISLLCKKTAPKG